MKEIYIWSDENKVTVFNDGVTKKRTCLIPFLLDNPAQAQGTILVLPGGGYCHFGMHEGEDVAKKFNQLGFNAYVLYYRHYPTTYPAPIEDAIRSIRIVRDCATLFGYNPDKISVLGFSAGAHLAASAAINPTKIQALNNDDIDQVSAKVNALILCYGVMNICNPKIGHTGSGDNLFGSSEITPLRETFDLYNQVNSDLPPTFLWHTANDAGVSVMNSIYMAEAIWKLGKVAELHVFPNGSHGLGLAPEHQDIKVWPELVANFLQN